MHEHFLIKTSVYKCTKTTFISVLNKNCDYNIMVSSPADDAKIYVINLNE